ncbi:ATP-binding cassette domain-containing protein [Pseudomonas aeruginosa]|uniref:ATP-binding cassette domain-containing protein n=1 Tax=Pseudomonas aeruginosa TaxID=287 RepID=UPI003D26A111
MHFLEVDVKGCNRLRLGNIEQFTFKPTEKTQLFLGPNGAGKSSLFGVILSVLPPSKRDFDVGGHLLRKVEHEGRIYQINAFFTDVRTEHEFIVDGKHLNPGKTVNAQLDLCKQHFRMTPDIHAVLTGENRFTSMSVSERRKWIIAMADTDFSYLLEFNERVKKLHRANKTMLEEYGKRHAEEVKKLMDDETLSQLELRAEELNRELSVVYRLHAGFDRAKCTALEKEIDAQYATLLVEQQALVAKLKTPLSYEHTEASPIQTLNNLTALIVQYESKIAQLNGRLLEVSERYEHAHRQMKQIEELSEVNVTEVSAKLTRAQARQAELIASLKYCKPADHAGETHVVRQAIDELCAALMESSRHDLTQYDKSSHAAISDKVELYLRKRYEIQSRADTLEQMIDHLSSVHSVDCPNCRYNFKPGVDASELAKLTEEHAACIQRLGKADTAIAAARDELSAFDDMRAALNTLSDLVGRIPQLSGVQMALKSQGLSLRSGAVTLSVCNQYRKELDVLDALTQLLVEMVPLEQTLKKVEDCSDESRHVQTSYLQLKEQTDALTRELSTHTTNLRRIKQFRERCLAEQSLADQLTQQTDDLSDKVEQLAEFQRQHVYQDTLADLQSSLAIVTEALNSHENQKTIVKDLANQVEKQAKDLEITKRLVDELSPGNGLIAEQVMLYLDPILDTLNQQVGAICHYPLVTLPCDVEKGELNYRFPVWAGEPTNVREDVSKASSGQKEMIDRAFVGCIYHFLDLRQYPLYLDEFGHKFDPQNRQNLIPVLADMIADDAFSQVFMISHDVSIYGPLERVEVTSLDVSAAHMEQKHNEHVVIV